MGAPRRTAVAGLVISLGGLVSVTGLWLTGAGDDVHAAPVDAGSDIALAERPEGGSGAHTTRPSPASSAVPRASVRVPTRQRPATDRVALVSGVQVHDARVGVQDAEQAPAPAGIRVPALGIDARVRPMGIEPTGEMELPGDPGSVGWYGYGPTPGDPGSAVVAGHVDGDGRPGAFFRLAELGPGARVTVTAADGSSRTFRVVSRRVFEKARLPTASVFRRGGAPVLTLITCGGAFDRATGHYASNVVVVATPV